MKILRKYLQVTTIKSSTGEIRCWVGCLAGSVRARGGGESGGGEEVRGVGAVGDGGAGRNYARYLEVVEDKMRKGYSWSVGAE